MQVVRSGSGVFRAAPVEGGPRAEVLIGRGGAARGDNLGAALVVVPPGGGMPEHDHGDSEALVAVQSGRVEISGGGSSETLEPGTVALLEVGERVRLANPSSSDEASLLVLFAPPSFVEALASWPEAT